MKLQLESYKRKYSVETEHEDVSMNDYFDIFVGLLTQAGWQQQTINDAIIELADSLIESK
jgi:hypothetical protein